MEDFKQWFGTENSGMKPPKGKELYEYLDKKYGPCKPNGWYGIAWVQPEETVDEIDELSHNY